VLDEAGIHALRALAETAASCGADCSKNFAQHESERSAYRAATPPTVMLGLLDALEAARAENQEHEAEHWRVCKIVGAAGHDVTNLPSDGVQHVANELADAKAELEATRAERDDLAVAHLDILRGCSESMTESEVARDAALARVAALKSELMDDRRTETDALIAMTAKAEAALARVAELEAHLGEHMAEFAEFVNEVNHVAAQARSDERERIAKWHDWHVEAGQDFIDDAARRGEAYEAYEADQEAHRTSAEAIRAGRATPDVGKAKP
jgi:chromosome segregation ATPase